MITEWNSFWGFWHAIAKWADVAVVPSTTLLGGQSNSQDVGDPSMLTACPASLWVDSDLGERSVPSPGRVVRRVAHETVNSSLPPKPAVRRFTVDENHDAAQTRFVTRA